MTGRPLLAAALALLLGGPAAAQAPADDPLAEALARARTRESIGVNRSESAGTRARAQALAAYRLARKRAATFLADPRSRAEQARALDAALWVLAREVREAALLREELAFSSRDRASLESAAAATSTAPPPHPADDAFDPRSPGPRLSWPARGALVRGPGLRRDDATLAVVREAGVRILSRLNEPARAPAAGRVQKVAALPRGGFALVTVHDDGAVSILSGLRQVEVAEGAAVEPGQRLGLVGRDLDGAPVVSFELWQRGRPIDPTPLLQDRRGRPTRDVSNL
jgi:septal ring factor EnvC (AmiA/AmiB activator)